MSATWIGVRVASGSGSIGDKGVRTYNLVHLVVTDDPGDGTMIVAVTTGVHQRGECYSFGNEEDAGALCKKVHPRQIEKYIWEVTCSFSSSGSVEQEENPLNRPDEVSWSSATHGRVVMQDKAVPPKAIVNSAGDAFDPGVEIDQTRMVLSITRNEPYFDYGQAFAYADAINSQPFFGAPAGCAKMACPRATLQYENDVMFWRVTYEIHFHPDGWDKHVLDIGPRHLEDEGENTLIVYATDDQGNKSTLPVPLNGQGYPLTKEQRLAGEFVYLTFPVYDRRSFSFLA